MLKNIRTLFFFACICGLFKTTAVSFSWGGAYAGNTIIENQSGVGLNSSGNTIVNNSEFERACFSGNTTISHSFLGNITSSGHLSAENIEADTICANGHVYFSYVTIKNKARISGFLFAKNSVFNSLTLSTPESSFMDSAARYLFVKTNYSGWLFKTAKPTVIILDGDSVIDLVVFENNIEGNRVIIKNKNASVKSIENGVIEDDIASIEL